MSEDLSYEDFLDRIDIQDLLTDAGYRQNRKDGLRWPVYQRYDGNGRVHGDKFIVTSNGKCCFRPSVYHNYNVVSFIKSFPRLFSDYAPGQSLDSLVFRICNRMLNTNKSERSMADVPTAYHHKPFDLSMYEVRQLDLKDDESVKAFRRFFGPRGITLETQGTFMDHFFLASKHRDGGRSYANLSFPLSIPNKDGIVGLEERGAVRPDGSSYKGKAQNSNGSEGLWIANLTGEPLDKAESVIWFESAYDAMAQFQIEGCKENRPYCVYVSTGGNPTIMQIRGMLAATPHSCHSVAFDKDLAGKQFMDNFRSIAEDMGFPHERVQEHQPLGYYKDWNDALLGKKTMTLKGVTQDYDYDKAPSDCMDRKPDNNVRQITFHL